MIYRDTVNGLTSISKIVDSQAGARPPPDGDGNLDIAGRREIMGASRTCPIGTSFLGSQNTRGDYCPVVSRVKTLSLTVENKSR